VWSSLAEITGLWSADLEVTPRPPSDARYEQWRRAVERSRGWERVTQDR
jgi:glycerol kinase